MSAVGKHWIYGIPACGVDAVGAVVVQALGPSAGRAPGQGQHALPTSTAEACRAIVAAAAATYSQQQRSCLLVAKMHSMCGPLSAPNLGNIFLCTQSAGLAVAQLHSVEGLRHKRVQVTTTEAAALHPAAPSTAFCQL